MSVKKGTLKRCPACGNFFLCKGEEDCWCESVKLHRKDMLRVMNEYEGCLCPNCLKKYESKV